MSDLLEVLDLCGGYGPAPVLSHASIVLGEGEIVGLLGANGAGKTTMLRGIAGSLPVCTGQVLIDGQPLMKMSPWERVRAGVAHVPEGRHVFPMMTVAENLAVAALAGRRTIDLEAIYDLFPRLLERSSQRAGTLSGGEQQMLAIGRAAMTGPRVLLIDEMSAGLAPVVVQHLVGALAAMRDLGISILVVEQSPHLVAEIVGRVYVLGGGAILGAGTLESLGGVERLAQTYLGIHS